MTGGRKKEDEEAAAPEGPRKMEGDRERYPEDEMVDTLRQEKTGEKDMDELYREVTGKPNAAREKTPPSRRGSIKRGD